MLRKKSIARNIDIKRSIILNEALNENCCIDKFNKSNCLRRLQKAMCTIYQTGIALCKHVFWQIIEVLWMLFWMEWYASFHLGVNISPGKRTSYLHMIFNSMSIIAERPKHSLQIKAGSLREKWDHQNINGLAEEINLNI